MKKLLIALICVVAFSGLHAQVFIQGGANFSNISDTKSGNTENNQILTTFNAGFFFRVNIPGPLDIESGFFVMGEGSQAETYFTSSRSDNYVRTNFNPLYLQIPVNLLYKIPMQGKIGVFINAGPYLQGGFGGQAKIETSTLGLKSSATENIEFDNGNPSSSAAQDARYNSLERFDFGFNFGAGIDLKKAIFRANYGLGLTKINSWQTNYKPADKNKYRTISVSLALPLRRR